MKVATCIFFFNSGINWYMCIPWVSSYLQVVQTPMEDKHIVFDGNKEGVCKSLPARPN